MLNSIERASRDMDWFDSAQDQLTSWKLREKAAVNYRKSFAPLAQKELDNGA